ncbi:HD-GYP domain-containing protein [Zoogloea sp.]|uniref:HD-GYP domain-containing protein n=1 Tax=Zoogloea sp. TaxID=49181 RepID=UPI0035AF0CC6
MTDPRADELARYGRWLKRGVGEAFSAAIGSAAGGLLWSDGDPTALGDALAACNAAPAGGDGMRRLKTGTGVAYVSPAPLPDGAGPGWLIAVPRDDAAPFGIELDAVAETMADVAATLADRNSLGAEMDVLAAELAERYEELHLFYDIDRHLAKQDLGAEVLQDLLKSCAEQLNADVACFVRPAENLTVSATNLSKPIHNLDLVLVEMRGDLFRFVSSSRATVVLNGMDDSRRPYIFTDMPYKVLACPVFQGLEMPAMLTLLNHQDKPDFTNSDRRLGEVMAHQISNVMHMGEMFAEMRRFTEQMAAALIEAVEAKDPYTRGHSERVHLLSMRLGEALRLRAEEMENLHWGSLLHDVGKIGIPDAVLCKPGRLTNDEYTFIKVHPERSYEILRHVDRLKGALAGARHHQEKFDGTGYPHGLRGSDIPLLARIIAVADTYDSITSSRAYRAGSTHEAAVREMRRVGSSQLDPELLERFLRLCDEDPAMLLKMGIRRECDDR